MTPKILTGWVILMAFLAKTMACHTAMDCSLNGDCVNGVCNCDLGWTGVACGVLRQGKGLVPYPDQNLPWPTNGRVASSWGGTIVQEDDLYHLFVNTVCANKTTMHDANAIIVHAVAKDIMGPYRYIDTALTPATTNPHIIKAPDGGYLLFNTLDNPSDDWVPCTGDRMPYKQQDVIPHSINVAYSKFLTGPWERYVLETEMGPYGKYYNPTAYIFENGTTILALTGYLVNNCTSVYCEKLVMLKAPDWRGPYKLLNSMIFEHSGEDPFLWRDKRGFHMLFHNFQTPGWNIDSPLVGGLAYSLDGVTWTRSETMVFTTTVPMIKGGSKKYSRRERPEIFFEDGVPKYLLTACQAVFALDKPSTFNIVPILTD